MADTNKIPITPADPAADKGRTIVSVDPSDVKERLMRLSAYVASKKKTLKEGAYGRIAMAKVDEAMLDKMWKTTAETLTNALRGKVDTVQMGCIIENPATYNVKLLTYGRFNEAMTEALESLCSTYFVNSIMSKWSAIADPDNTQYYTSLAQNNLNEIMTMVYHKTAPTRRQYKPTIETKPTADGTEQSDDNA